MDKDELNRFGARVLLERIRSFGIWPILEGDDKWRVENFDLTSLLIHVSKIRRVHVFVKHTISLDSRNVSRCLIQFDRGSLKLAADSYLDKETFGETAYRQFLTDLVARLLQDAGLPKNETKIANDVDEIIDLETRLGNITAPKVNRRNHTEMYNLRRLSCMQKLIPSVNWTRYFHSIAPDDVHDYFSSNPEIVIVEIDYMRRVADILQSTDPRIITNYVYLKYASIWVEEMGEQYENISQVNTMLRGVLCRQKIAGFSSEVMYLFHLRSIKAAVHQ
ncbi:hypothetical protein Y032_0145g2513 [Ancylostoma ceylanicum]|uniref:Peptidase M13 N-terminal domain-containing protein n=1 Tax=Ancylostoma ceylanicum TaxID=53326 RepID=A0A016T1T5_9BILA|nr:hypothetical protein Y032_0145g2513 [Ancylostoma ceylanicum]